MGMFSQLAQGVDWSSMGQMILRIAAVLLCLVIHEVATAWRPIIWVIPPPSRATGSL